MVNGKIGVEIKNEIFHYGDDIKINFHLNSFEIFSYLKSFGIKAKKTVMVFGDKTFHYGEKPNVGNFLTINNRRIHKYETSIHTIGFLIYNYSLIFVPEGNNFHKSSVTRNPKFSTLKYKILIMGFLRSFTEFFHYGKNPNVGNITFIKNLITIEPNIFIKNIIFIHYDDRTIPSFK